VIIPDPALLARHDLPRPRYTSYPTVAHWSDAPSESRWIEDQRAGLESGGAALYVHIPFCQSLCSFCGCHMRVARNHAMAGPYIDVLLAELALYRQRLAQARLPVAQLYLGGGTPNFLPAEELDRLLGGLLEHAVRAPGTDFNIEADPRFITRAQLTVLRRHGFDRIGFGVQDMDPRVQDIVNRQMDFGRLQQAVDEARASGFTSVGFDLIHGLPLQTSRSIELTLDAVERLRPERIMYYPYAHVPWIKPSQRRYTEADLPEGDARRALQILGRERMAEAGYLEIGMDQFVLPQDELARAARDRRLHRNFMGYSPVTTRALLGLGVSAIGDATASLAQNDKSQQRYEQRVAAGELPLQRGHVLSAEDRQLRGHILALLTRMETSWSPAETDTPLRAAVEARLAELQSDGLVECAGDRVKVTESGRVFLRSICAAFDLKLQATQGSLAA